MAVGDWDCVFCGQVGREIKTTGHSWMVDYRHGDGTTRVGLDGRFALAGAMVSDH